MVGPFLFFQERPDQGAVLVSVEGVEHDVAARLVVFLELVEDGVGEAAGDAPGGPEVHDLDLALEVGQADGVAAEAGEAELEGVPEVAVGVGGAEGGFAVAEEAGGAVVGLEDEIAETLLRTVELGVELAHDLAVVGAVLLGDLRVEDGEGVGVVEEGVLEAAGLEFPAGGFAGGLAGGEKLITLAGEGAVDFLLALGGGDAGSAGGGLIGGLFEALGELQGAKGGGGVFGVEIGAGESGSNWRVSGRVW
jgi:hypothetical protein